jgi:ribosome-associated protein
MAKKKTRFEWTADEDDPDRVVPVDRESRSVLKAQLEHVDELVQAMVALPAAERRFLPLDDDVLHELDVLAGLPPGPAIKRQLHYVRRLVAAVDIDALDAALAGETPRAAWLRSLERWRTRLLTEGDAALTDFVDAHPHVDRQQLRTLVRQADDPRSRRRLFEALKEQVPEPE